MEGQISHDVFTAHTDYTNMQYAFLPCKWRAQDLDLHVKVAKTFGDKTTI